MQFTFPTYVLGLSQCNEAEIGRNLSNLFFNVAGTGIKNSEYGMVASDFYHLPLVTDVLLPTRWLLHSQGLSNLNYASGDYFMLYESLANCGWSCVYKLMYVDIAVDSLNTAVYDATT
jgi:hypothetical protein